MRKTIIAAAMGITALFTLSGGAFGAGDKVHQVVKDDTLWDITDTYFNDPWLWPAVWRNNPDIKNPHLIYPNQLVKLPGFSSFAVDCGTHQVVKGDTLWHISGTYLHDFFLWPAVWRKNPGIKNPHLIYPGQLVKIPCLDKEKEQPESLAESSPPPKPIKREETLHSEQAQPEPNPEVGDGAVLPVVMVEKEKIDHDDSGQTRKFKTLYDLGLGEIIKNPVLKGRIQGQDRGYTSGAHGETLLVDWPEAVIGKTYGVYRDLGAVRHPAKLWGKLGNLIMDIGIVEIVPGPAGKPVARVLRAFQEIKRGDFFGPVPQPAVMALDEKMAVTPDLKGTVIAIHERMAVTAGRDSIIYIDAGRDKGLRPGCRLYLEEKNDSNSSSAELLVLRVGDTTSAALVAHASLHVITTGDRFKAVKN